jgi:hypothetical protein
MEYLAKTGDNVDLRHDLELRRRTLADPFNPRVCLGENPNSDAAPTLQVCGMPSSHSAPQTHTPLSTALPSPFRICAVAAPALLLLYGALRLVDGSESGRGAGLIWNLSHIMFLIAFVLFGVLIVGLGRLATTTVRWQRTSARAAVVVGLVGVVGFVWVGLGDIFARLSDYAQLPDQVLAVGPLLFQLGLLALLVQLAATRSRQLPAWSPLLVLLGFGTIDVNLDLLPIGAALILWGLAGAWRP